MTRLAFALAACRIRPSCSGLITHELGQKGAGSTGAAANVDMKLVKKHSQLIWNDLRRHPST